MMRFFGRVPQVSTGGGGTYGVASLNSLVGILRLIEGSNISISAAGNEITITATIPANVESLNTLTGALSLLAGTDISVTPGANSLTIGYTGTPVDSLNSLTGNVNLVAGANIGLSVADNEITITSSAGAGVADLGWYFASDYANLQAAINACPTGGVLYIPPGNYTVSSPLTCNKAITIMGAGRATQIYMSADDDLFQIGNGVTDYQYGVIRDLWLGSSAVTAGKSLLKLNYINDWVIQNVGLVGGNYGIHVMGMRNVFKNCYHITNSALFFHACSNCKTICRIDDGVTYSSNGNEFYGVRFRGNASNDYGLYYYETRNEGMILICGGIFEGLAQAGIYLRGLAYGLTLIKCYTEGASGNRIVINSCSPGILIDCSSTYVDIIASTNITTIGGYIGGLTVDANSRHPVIIGTKIGTRPYSILGTQEEVSHVTQTSSELIDEPGISNFGENIVDGTMENFSGGLPVGFIAENGATIAQEGTTKKFGSYSARVTLTGTRGGIEKIISGTEYITGESISFAMWVYAPVGVTPHIYCHFIGPSLNSFTVTYGVAGAGSWQRIKGTLVLRSDATEVGVGYGVYSGSVGNQVYIDGLELRYGGQVSPVGDGR